MNLSEDDAIGDETDDKSSSHHTIIGFHPRGKHTSQWSQHQQRDSDWG